VCGVGEIDVDIYLQVPSVPLATEKSRGDPIEFHPGGMIGNFLVNIRRCGLRAIYQGRVGVDRFGDLAMDALRREGVDVSLATKRSEDHTFFCVVLHDGGGEKQLVTAVTPCKDYGPGDVAEKVLASSRHVHTNLTPGTPWLVALAREHGCSVSVDIDEFPSEDIVAWARDVDVLFVAERSPQDGSAGQRVVSLLDHGCQMIVATKGADGAAAHRLVDGALVVDRVNTPQVDVVDTTGAGDCFAGWLISQLLRDTSLHESLRLASAAAALSTRGRGPQSTLPTRQEVEPVARTLHVETSRYIR
jgi:ribokinase